MTDYQLLQAYLLPGLQPIEGEHLLAVPAEVLGWLLIGPTWSCTHLWVHSGGQRCLLLIDQTVVT